MSHGRNLLRGWLPFTCPPALAPRWYLPALVLALFAVGCTHLASSQDPLRGYGPEIPKNNTTAPPAAAVVTNPANPASPKTPATPTSTSAGPSNAALVSGGPPPSAETEHPAPTLHPPTTNNLGSSNIVPISTSSGDSYEDLQNQLKSYGVTSQSLRRDPDKDEWSFYCQIPDRNVKNLLKPYEGHGSGGNGLPAIRDALNRIKMNPP